MDLFTVSASGFLTDILVFLKVRMAPLLDTMQTCISGLAGQQQH